MGFDLGQAFNQFQTWSGNAVADATNTLTGNTFGTGGINKLKTSKQAQDRNKQEGALALDALRASKQTDDEYMASMLAVVQTGTDGSQDIGSAFATIGKATLAPSTAANMSAQWLKTKPAWSVQAALHTIGTAIQIHGGSDSVTESARASDGQYWLKEAAKLNDQVAAENASANAFLSTQPQYLSLGMFGKIPNPAWHPPTDQHAESPTPPPSVTTQGATSAGGAPTPQGDPPVALPTGAARWRGLLTWGIVLLLVGAGVYALVAD